MPIALQAALLLVISNAFMIPFSILYMKAPVGADYLWASLCILGAVFFMFRSS
jgi:uncharacterized protein